MMIASGSWKVVIENSSQYSLQKFGNYWFMASVSSSSLLSIWQYEFFLCKDKFLYLYLHVCVNLLYIFKKGEDKMTRLSFLEDITYHNFLLFKWTRLISLYFVLALLSKSRKQLSLPLFRFSLIHWFDSERKVLRYFINLSLSLSAQ